MNLIGGMLVTGCLIGLIRALRRRGQRSRLVASGPWVIGAVMTLPLFLADPGGAPPRAPLPFDTRAVQHQLSPQILWDTKDGLDEGLHVARGLMYGLGADRLIVIRLPAKIGAESPTEVAAAACLGLLVAVAEVDDDDRAVVTQTMRSAAREPGQRLTRLAGGHWVSADVRPDGAHICTIRRT